MSTLLRYLCLMMCSFARQSVVPKSIDERCACAAVIARWRTGSRESGRWTAKQPCEPAVLWSMRSADRPRSGDADGAGVAIFEKMSGIAMRRMSQILRPQTKDSHAASASGSVCIACCRRAACSKETTFVGSWGSHVGPFRFCFFLKKAIHIFSAVEL